MVFPPPFTFPPTTPPEEENPLAQNLPATGFSQQPTPAATSSSASFRGVTDQGISQAHKVFSPTDRRIAAQTAPLQSQAQDQLEQHRSSTAALGDAQSEQARLTTEYQSNLAKLKDEERLFHQDAAALEERMHAETKAESEQYVGAYREQLAAVRAMTVDPTGPIASLSTAQAGGLSLAMFAQGFLAAQGIQIDVAGQLDRWVDRSIQEQQRRIQQAEKGAQDMLNLWEIARQSSRDDLEARTRYRGMVISSMMAATESKAAQFNSDIAVSRAKEANAKLAIELQTTERQIQDGYFNKVHAIKQAEYQRSYQMGSLAQQSRQAAETERHHREMEGAAKLKAMGDKPYLIKDVGDFKIDPKTGKQVSGGRVIAMVNPDDKEAIKIVNGVQKSHGELLKGLDDLEKLRKEAFGLGIGKTLGSLTSEEYRRFSRRRGLITASIQKAMTGLHATKHEQELYLSQLEDEKLWQAGNNESTLTDLRGWSRDMYNNALNNTLGVQIIPEDQRFYSDFVNADPVTGAMEDAAEAARKGEKLPPGAASTAFSRATDADSQEPLFKGEARPELETNAALFKRFSEETSTKDQYRREHQAMETLADMIVKPEKYIDTAGETADEIRQEAVTALSGLKDKDPYATYLLKIVQTNPADLGDITAIGLNLTNELRGLNAKKLPKSLDPNEESMATLSLKE